MKDTDVQNHLENDRRVVRLNEAFQYVDDRFLDLVEQEKCPGKKRSSVVRKGSAHRRHTWVVSGAVAVCFLVLLVLPVGVIAKDWLGLRSLLLPGLGTGQKSGEEILAGYRESQEVQACAQWKALLQEYTASGGEGTGKEGTETQETGTGKAEDSAGYFWPAAWTVYGVTDRKLGAGLDRIAAQYGLRLLEEKNVVTLEELEQAVGGRFLGGIREKDPIKDCILYGDGSFVFAGEAALKECGSAQFRFYRAGKRYLQEDLPLAGSEEEYTCRQYENAGGESVLLVWNDQTALILAEYKTWYILVELQTCKGRATEESLREMADRIDFTNIKYGTFPGVQGYVELPGREEISTAGFADSAEAKALAEWHAFLEEYDTDGKVLEQAPCIFYAEGRNDWYQYNVYSYEMGEMLDEIARKYDLKLHTDVEVMEPEGLEQQVGGSFLSEDCTSYWGYMYEDGSFQMEADAKLEPGQVTDFQLGRAVKGTLDESTLNVGRLEDYREWQYMTQEGEWVLLILGPYKAMIFGDFEECFIWVNVLSGSAEGMSQENLQDLADKIHFQILKKVQVPTLDP